MTLNKISPGLKALMDAESTNLDKLVAVIQALLGKVTKLVFYSGVPSSDLGVFTGGGVLVSFDCPAGTWDGLSYTGWSGMHNQDVLTANAVASGAATMVRIEDLAGRAYFAFDLSNTIPPGAITDFTFSYPWEPAFVAGTEYQVPRFAIGWGYTSP